MAYDYNFNGSQARYEAEHKKLREAKERWNESEWVLSLMRSKTGTEVKPWSDEQITEWHHRLKQL